MHTSMLHRFSIGIAAENKPLNTRMLNIVPIELMPALDGELVFDPEQQKISGVDKNGETFEIAVTTDVSISAEWLPLGTNRLTPPDIRRGELIEIYRVADSDQYFWRCMGLRDELRRLETVIWVFNGSPDLGSEGIDPETSYFLEISTHRGIVTFSTSKANNEKCTYTVQFNPMDGTFRMEDDVGNFFDLDTIERIWKLSNADDTYLELNKKDATLHADRDLLVDIARDATVKIGRDLTSTIGRDVTIEIGQDESKTVGRNYTEDITGNVSSTVGGDCTEDIGGNASSTIGGNNTLSVGGNHTVNASGNGNITATVLTLTGGGSTLELASGGTTLTTPTFNGGS